MNTKKTSATTALKAVAMVFALILPLANCNFFGMPEYELSVTVEDGVTGTPAVGVQSLADLTEVEYKYTPVNAKHTVEVIYDGAQAAAAGTIKMYKSITLVARLIDIRTIWNITVYDSNAVAISTYTITFSGTDILGGTFTDSSGHSGTWDGASNVINIIYSNWEKYKLTGTLFAMSGTWTNGTATGSWVSARK
jgi:hypothetical protein